LEICIFFSFFRARIDVSRARIYFIRDGVLNITRRKSKLWVRNLMPLTELMTFKVSKEMKEKMQKYDNVNWSAEIRGSIRSKIEELERVEKIASVNFCPQCGKRLISAADNFCRLCGAAITR
jgi:hypothetical protein